MAPDVEAATGLVRQGAVADAVGADLLPRTDPEAA